MILPITPAISGAAALINFWLAWRVGQKRLSEKVSIGDGGNPAVLARMRAHANYVEFTPFVLILIGLDLINMLKDLYREGVVRVRFVIQAALTSIAQNLIVLDTTRASPLSMLGLAALVIALAVAVRVMREMPDRNGG